MTYELFHENTNVESEGIRYYAGKWVLIYQDGLYEIERNWRSIYKGRNGYMPLGHVWATRAQDHALASLLREAVSLGIMSEADARAEYESHGQGWACPHHLIPLDSEHDFCPVCAFESNEGQASA